MSESPAVSVFISSYNHARYLPQTIESVLSQSFQDFELLIVDDGSTDNSHEVLSGYQQRYPDKIHYFWHEGHANRGIPYSCNVALARAAGAYLAWLGSDDFWLPEKLAKQVQFLINHPEVGMVHSPALTVDSSGSLYPVLLPARATVIPTYAWQQLAIANPICASTAMVTHAALDDVGGFNEHLVFCDWELWIRIAGKYPIGFIAEPLAAYRVHGQNISISPQRAAAVLQHNMAVIESVCSQLPQMEKTVENRARANAYAWAGLDSFAGGQSEQGRTYLLQAAQLLGSPLPYESEAAFIEAISAYAVHMLQAANPDVQHSARFVQTISTSIAPHLRRRATAKYYMTNAFISHAAET